MGSTVSRLTGDVGGVSSQVQRDLQDRGYHMTTTALAVFVLVSFLVPVPILAWLDRSRDRSAAEEG